MVVEVRRKDGHGGMSGRRDAAAVEGGSGEGDDDVDGLLREGETNESKMESDCEVGVGCRKRRRGPR